MKRVRDWLINKIGQWLFTGSNPTPIPPIKPPIRFDAISGWDDTDCFYAGEYENVLEKGQHF